MPRAHTQKRFAQWISVCVVAIRMAKGKFRKYSLFCVRINGKTLKIAICLPMFLSGKMTATTKMKPHRNIKLFTCRVKRGSVQCIYVYASNSLKLKNGPVFAYYEDGDDDERTCIFLIRWEQGEHEKKNANHFTEWRSERNDEVNEWALLRYLYNPTKFYHTPYRNAQCTLWTLRWTQRNCGHHFLRLFSLHRHFFKKEKKNIFSLRCWSGRWFWIVHSLLEHLIRICECN